MTFCKLTYACSLPNSHDSPLFWTFRYIDDLFFILKSSLQLETLLTILKDIYALSRLKSITSDSSGNNVVFLDLQVSTFQVIQARLKFRMYRKPGICYQYPHFDSCINSSIKTAVIISKSWRIIARFDNVSDCTCEFTKFSRLLKFCGYSSNFVYNTLEKFLHRVESIKDDSDYRLYLTTVRILTTITLLDIFLF
jgi:hypothetical protein